MSSRDGASIPHQGMHTSTIVWTFPKRSHIRSVARVELSVPCSKRETFGTHSFSVCGRFMCNTLPLTVREYGLSFGQFTTWLKQYYLIELMSWTPSAAWQTWVKYEYQMLLLTYAQVAYSRFARSSMRFIWRFCNTYADFFRPDREFDLPSHRYKSIPLRVRG